MSTAEQSRAWADVQEAVSAMLPDPAALSREQDLIDHDPGARTGRAGFCRSQASRGVQTIGDAMTEHRKHRLDPKDAALFDVLQNNLASATDPELRRRLQQEIDRLTRVTFLSDVADAIGGDLRRLGKLFRGRKP